MLTTRKIIAIITGVLGLLLIGYGVWGGIWPLSIQLIAGILLVVMAVFRWRTLS